MTNAFLGTGLNRIEDFVDAIVPSSDATLSSAAVYSSTIS